MAETPNWNINVKGLSLTEIVNLLRQLDGTKHKDKILELQRELVNRARTEGVNDEAIIRTLARGGARGLDLDAVAKKWAGVLDVSVKEFKRIANVK